MRLKIVLCSIVSFTSIQAKFIALTSLTEDPTKGTYIFQALLKDRKKFTVAFFAPVSCTYCLLKELFYNQATLSFMRFCSGKVHFISVNTQHYPEIATFYTIKTTPVLVYYSNGKEVYRSYSAPTLTSLRHTVRRYFGI